MKTSLLLLTLLSSTLLAASAPKTVTLAERGGMVTMPNSSRGSVAVVNLQKKVPAGEFAAVVSALDRNLQYDFLFVDSEAAAKNATLKIRLVDKADGEPFLAAPESGWAEMNVARLTDDLKSESAKARFLVGRARKMFLRAFAYASGSGGSGFSGNLFDTSSVRDLDYVKESLPVDVRDSIERHLRKRGMAVRKTATYEDACEEGWAPAPTNDIQKAIWKRVYEPPKTPMKIEFDPKKGR